MEFFKKYDIIEELDSKISKDENVFVEAAPNKIPFVFKYIKPYILIAFAMILFDFLYSIFYPKEYSVVRDGFEMFLIAINFTVLFFVCKAVYIANLIYRNTYYVITDRGIHFVKGGRSLDYTFCAYEDIKSIFLNKYKYVKNKGDIIIKDISTPNLKSLKEKFFFVNNGLIAIDDVQQVYNILKQVAIQENQEIFLSDDTNNLKVDYFRDVKKYNKKIEIDKNDSVMKRRGQ